MKFYTRVLKILYQSTYSIILLLGGDDMINQNSKINKQIANNLALEGMYLTRDQQKQILEAINNKKEITNELIREIALK